MRTVEIENVTFSRRRERHKGGLSISSGHSEVIKYLDEAEVLVISPIDTSPPTIMVNGENVFIRRYKESKEFSDYLNFVEEVPSTEIIKLESDEQIKVVKKTGRRSGKAMWVWINSDENESDFIETVPDPAESLPIKV